MDKYNHWAICKGCGTQYGDVAAKLATCPICDDPRQYVPPTGQAWTTLPVLRKDHRNTFQQDPVEKGVWSIFTEPKFAIGQRALLIETPAGNVLWDLISLVDQETVDFIRSVGTGKLSAIVISHPHFYTTNRVWADVFDCPVYVASEDTSWLYTSPDQPTMPPKSGGQLKLLHNINTEIMEGMTVIKCGGHFPGSLCIHYKNMLFSSDTVMTVQTARNPEKHIFEGTNAFSFMWSIPNMIPLDPKTIYQIWSRIKPFDYDTNYGNIPGLDVKNKQVKAWILKSAKIQVSKMGWEGKEEGELVLHEQID